MLFATAAGILCAADLNRGKELYAQGKYADAVTELQQVVKDKDDDEAAHRYLGLALLNQEKTDEAARHLERAWEIDRNDENKLALARLAVAQKNLDRAEELIKDASGEELEYVRGIIHLHRDRHEEAAKDLESYLEKKPENAYAHYYAGLAYNGLRRPDKMLTHFEQFLRMRPDAPEARKVRAVMKTGR
jgi:tetratricopeptide (TPR) repeat protein